ncbi:hypothetical protein ABPG77_002257 [Micractinium sp. CCAP 211/92]
MRRQGKTECQVAGCTVDLTTLRSYFLRQKICEEHAKAASIPDGHGGFVRFCQQCTKLEPVSAFEGTKRSCRISLIKRHDRHRQHASRKRGRRGSKYSQPSDSSSGSGEQRGGSSERRVRQRGASRGSPLGSVPPGEAAGTSGQQQLLDAAALAAAIGGLGGGSGAGGLSSLLAGAGSQAGATPLQVLLSRLGVAALGQAVKQEGGAQGAAPEPPLPSTSNPLAVLFEAMCEQSSKAAAAATAAGTASQALLSSQGSPAAQDAQRLVQDMQMLQQLQSQVLQRLQGLVQSGVGTSRGSPQGQLPAPELPQPASLQQPPSQQRPPVFPSLPQQPQQQQQQQDPSVSAARLELLLSLLHMPTPQQQASPPGPPASEGQALPDPGSQAHRRRHSSEPASGIQALELELQSLRQQPARAGPAEPPSSLRLQELLRQLGLARLPQEQHQQQQQQQQQRRQQQQQ